MSALLPPFGILLNRILGARKRYDIIHEQIGSSDFVAGILYKTIGDIGGYLVFKIGATPMLEPGEEGRDRLFINFEVHPLFSPNFSFRLTDEMFPIAYARKRKRAIREARRLGVFDSVFGAIFEPERRFVFLEGDYIRWGRFSFRLRYFRREKSWTHEYLLLTEKEGSVRSFSEGIAIYNAKMAEFGSPLIKRAIGRVSLEEESSW